MITFATWDEFFRTLLTTLAPIVAGGLVFLSKQAFSFITTKINAVKNDQLRQGLIAAEREAERVTNTVVSALNQTIVDDLKSQNGNKLSPADAVRVRNDAMTRITQILSDEAQNILINHKKDLDAYLGNLLEEAVGNRKTGVTKLISG